MSVRTVCYIEVNGLYVVLDAVGRSYEARFLGNPFVLSIPSNGPEPEWEAALPDHAWLGALVTQSSNFMVTLRAQEVLTVRTSIESARDDVFIRDETRDASQRTPAQAWLERHQRWSMRLLSAALNVLRVQSGQYWLGRELERVTVARTDFRDAEGATLTVQRNARRAGTGRVLAPSQVTSQETIAAAVAQAARHDEPPLPETLLADARYLAARGEYREALLLAAVANEAAVKQTVRSAATDAQQRLVVLLLNSPRDYSMAAASLFDKAMFAVVGRSLRQEAPALYKRVNKLFEDRNKVAHGMANVDRRDVNRHMVTAGEALVWLSTVERGQ